MCIGFQVHLPINCGCSIISCNQYLFSVSGIFVVRSLILPLYMLTVNNTFITYSGKMKITESLSFIATNWKEDHLVGQLTTNFHSLRFFRIPKRDCTPWLGFWLKTSDVFVSLQFLICFFVLSHLNKCTKLLCIMIAAPPEFILFPFERSVYYFFVYNAVSFSWWRFLRNIGRDIFFNPFLDFLFISIFTA